ncbi:MAG: CpsD/CapB family tyrosine-protein kinase, partial [Calditrichota bacterium]
VLGVVPALQIAGIFPGANHRKEQTKQLRNKTPENGNSSAKKRIKGKTRSKNISEVSPILVPTDQTMTEIERLEVKLIWFNVAKANQTILVTSSVGGDGKSTISLLLAQAIAKNINKKTLLIDFDLRRSKQHHLFGVDREPGLSDLLTSDIPVTSCLRDTPFPNLTLITGGKKLESPDEFLKINNIENFMVKIVDHFEYIIIDSPPVLPVSDPLILSKLVDQIVFVIKAGFTSKNMVYRTMDMLEDLDVRVTGVVLNNLGNVLPYYYNHKYYGYSYDKKNSSAD